MQESQLKGSERFRAFFSWLPRIPWDYCKLLYHEVLDPAGEKLKRPRGLIYFWFLLLFARSGFLKLIIDTMKIRTTAESYFFGGSLVLLWMWYEWERGRYVPWWKAKVNKQEEYGDSIPKSG